MNKDLFLNLNLQREKLLKIIEGFNEKEKILKALSMAEEAHKKQIRDGHIPYIIHPIRSAILLVEKAKIKNSDLICALLLHDTLEDTDLTAQEIKEEMGDYILKLVRAVTRERPDDETEEEKIKNKEKNIEKISQSSEEVRLIKLCDRLDNRYSQDFIPEGHPSRKKFKRWNKDFIQYTSIAQKTSPYLFYLFKEISKK